MMNNTYSLIISQSERAWGFQWARTLFALERRLAEGEKLAHLRRYSINMGAGSGAAGEHFAPGLMIIKRIDWTRAERRRKLVGLWQVSCGRLLLALLRPVALTLRLPHRHIERPKEVDSAPPEGAEAEEEKFE